ncbi:MAG: LacI family DNA-binding transcriptional regulator [Opitutae bacterium]|nr:LacI family DNA-binding transcriptional regulator [Opitutae bacterium]
MPTRRVTQRDIAIKAGVGRSTVTLALKGHPKISPATRLRIEKAARALNSEPDPMLSALAAYRNRIRTQAFHGTLAWMVNWQPGYDWESGPYYSGYFAGAAERAKAYGYRLERFLLNAEGVTAERLASIFRARNISGILLCPQPRAGVELAFEWEQFSAVTFGYTLVKPLLTTVASAHFLNTRHVVRELARRGYRRIGLAIDDITDRRCGSNVLAGHLVEKQLDAALAPIPAFLDCLPHQTHLPDYGRKLKAYIEEHRLDALVTSEYQILDALKRIGVAVPRQLGVAGLSLPSTDTPLSGVVEDSVRIGAVAMDMLIGMVQRGERGVPATPIRTHLEGLWHEGRTVRAL